MWLRLVFVSNYPNQTEKILVEPKDFLPGKTVMRFSCLQVTTSASDAAPCTHVLTLDTLCFLPQANYSTLSLSDLTSKMSKLGKVARGVAEVVTKKTYKPSFVDFTIPAQGASVGPPLGPVIGEYGIPINKFVSDFNEATKELRKGVPIPTRVHIDGKKFRLELKEPCVKYLIKQAAGVRKGGSSKEIVGKITLPHVYEIARVKSQQVCVCVCNYV